jgi:hypothetical protein
MRAAVCVSSSGGDAVTASKDLLYTTMDDLRPGDFTVTPVIKGYMIGKVIPRRGLGPWWTFIKIVSAEDDAIRHAVTLALTEDSRVWLQDGPRRFRSVENAI